MSHPGSHRVDVELVLLRQTGTTGSIGYRVVRSPLAAATTPDAAARALGGDVRAIHSTSWRYQDGILVLTYAAVPDPDPALPAWPLSSAAVASSGDPLVPSPAGLALEHVVAHAVRHLAHLTQTDPGIARSARLGPDAALWSGIRSAGLRAATVVARVPAPSTAH